MWIRSVGFQMPPSNVSVFRWQTALHLSLNEAYPISGVFSGLDSLPPLSVLTIGNHGAALIAVLSVHEFLGVINRRHRLWPPNPKLSRPSPTKQTRWRWRRHDDPSRTLKKKKAKIALAYTQ